MSNIKLGVFICDCGDQIASILDMDVLEKGVHDFPEVGVVRRLRYSCSPDGLATMRAIIGQGGLNRVLVAGCTPRTLEPRLKAACEEAGLNGGLLQLVDIREGCARAHQDEPQIATAKALDLIRMGVASLVLREARQPISAEVVPAALVIGGGIAGITAALTLASAGVAVKLVERESALGGMLRHAHTLYPGGYDATEFLATKIEAVTHHPQVEVLLNSQVTGISGTAGHYTVNVAPSATDSNGPLAFDVGAIIVATGACVSQPKGLFHYDGQRVVTQFQFERELAGSSVLPLGGEGDDDLVPSNGLGDVVMILCAGQRNTDVPYCSGVCCMAALKQAIEAKAICPQANVTILFRDLYLPGDGMHQAELARARQAGVQFMRYALLSAPVVSDEAVEVYDELSGKRHRLPYGRVVLASPLLPQPDASVVAQMLNIVQDQNGFFPEVRYRLRPQNYVERGIHVCGAAHYPADWRETEFQAISAAFNAIRYLQAGTVTSWAPVAIVNKELCTGCGNCARTCAFGAISMRKRGGVLDLAQIDPLLCTGCGNCAVACPVKAIGLPEGSDAQILAQIDAALATAPANGRLCILAFGCEWSGYAAAELAGAHKLSYPADVRLIRVGCSARFDPLHVLWALFRGADGVFLGACPPGDCHYINGNRYAQERINTLCELLAKRGFDQRRVRLEWITPDDAQDFVSKITDFTNLVRALGPSPARAREPIKL